MLRYNCEYCEYHTDLKANFTRHLKSRKHLRLINNDNNCDDIIIIKKGKMKMNQNEPKMNQNEPKMNQNEPIMNQPPIKKFICDHCKESFKTKPSMRRHQLHRCKNHTEASINTNYNIEKNLLEKKHEREKKQMYKQIEKLLEKVGDTITNNTFNQTNNIVLNNYGNEDLSHVTTTLLDKLITSPYQMINNLTKIIHFNDQKPENMNIYIPNKNQKYIKVYKNNKWLLEEKKDTIPDIVDKNYNILDSHYEDSGNENLNKVENKNYKIFQAKLDNRDEDILDLENNKCELEILNNTKNVVKVHDVVSS